MSGSVLSEAFLKRFMGRFVVTESGCWEWSKAVDEDGYGWFWDGRRNQRAHRVSLAIHLGRELKGLALHTCDCPSCVNPLHLYEGDQLDNERDKINRGRHANQKKAHCSQGHELTEENIYHPPKHPTWRYCRKCRSKENS